MVTNIFEYKPINNRKGTTMQTTQLETKEPKTYLQQLCVGKLGQYPHEGTTKNGTTYYRNTIGVCTKNESNEYVWTNYEFTLWGSRIENINLYQNGDIVAVSGRLEETKYQNKQGIFVKGWKLEDARLVNISNIEQAYTNITETQPAEEEPF